MFVTRVRFFHVQCHVRHLVTLVMSHGRSSGSLKVVPKNRGTYYAMATGRPEPRAADWEGPTWKKTWKGDNNWNNKDWALHKIEVNFDEKSVTEHWRKDNYVNQLQKPAPPPSETSTVSKPEDDDKKGGKGGGKRKRGLHKVDREQAAGKTTTMTMKKPGAKLKPQPKKRPSEAQGSKRK